jgi:hypothetical protein
VVHLAVQGHLYLIQQASSVEPLRLRIDLLPPGDEHEPNDSPDQAVELLPDRPIQAITDGDDPDWFAVRGPLDVRVERSGSIQVAPHRPDGAPDERDLEILALARGERLLLLVKGEGAYGLRLVSRHPDLETEAGSYPRDPPPLRVINDFQSIFRE